MANIAAHVPVPDLLKNRRGRQILAVFAAGEGMEPFRIGPERSLSAPEETAQVRLREAPFAQDGAERAGRDVPGMHRKRDAPSYATQFDPFKLQVRPALSKLNESRPQERGPQVASRPGHRQPRSVAQGRLDRDRDRPQDEPRLREQVTRDGGGSVAARGPGMDRDLLLAEECLELNHGVVVHGRDGPFDRFDDHRVGVVEIVAPTGNVELEDFRRYGVSIRVESRSQGKIPALQRGRGSAPAAASFGRGVINGHRGGIVLRHPFTVACRRAGYRWGRLGRWRFEKPHSPHDLDRVL